MLRLRWLTCFSWLRQQPRNSLWDFSSDGNSSDYCETNCYRVVVHLVAANFILSCCYGHRDTRGKLATNGQCVDASGLCHVGRSPQGETCCGLWGSKSRASDGKNHGRRARLFEPAVSSAPDAGGHPPLTPRCGSDRFTRVQSTRRQLSKLIKPSKQTKASPAVLISL